MQFSTIALSLMSLGGALAQQTVHVVSVGSNNGSLIYSPNNLKANVGDMVQFQFFQGNHSVTQSAFDAPCMPISMSSNNATDLFSGFNAVKATDTEAPLYTVKITSMTPMWMYCSQGKHCQSGMVMVINENTSANSSRSLENYKQLASKATANLAPSGGASGGSASTTSASNGTATESGGSSKSTNAASAVRVSDAMGLAGVLALGMALFF